jgi:hypothetical protein
MCAELRVEHERRLEPSSLGLSKFTIFLSGAEELGLD